MTSDISSTLIWPFDRNYSGKPQQTPKCHIFKKNSNVRESEMIGIALNFNFILRNKKFIRKGFDYCVMQDIGSHRNNDSKWLKS